MAIKPTIYKLDIALSDMEREHYDRLNLTIALHPSETLERMMVRVLAFCLNAQENLSFAKGLSTAEEPDIWGKTLDDQIELWIEIGEPSVERIKKATHIAKNVRIYCFNHKSDTWFAQARTKLEGMKAEIFQFQWAQIQNLAGLAERTMKLSVTVSGNSAFVATNLGECDVSWNRLFSPTN